MFFDCLRGCQREAHTALRDEEESGRGSGDGFHVFLIVAAVVVHQQVVEDAHNAHGEQEEEDTLSKHVAWGAASPREKILVRP